MDRRLIADDVVHRLIMDGVLSANSRDVAKDIIAGALPDYPAPDPVEERIKRLEEWVREHETEVQEGRKGSLLDKLDRGDCPTCFFEYNFRGCSDRRGAFGVKCYSPKVPPDRHDAGEG